MSNFTKNHNSNNTKLDPTLAQAVYSSTAPNYGRERLQSLNLTHSEGFEPYYNGNIGIQYFDIDGNREYYNSPDERKTLSIECPEEFRNRKPYKASRLAPENISEGRKYIRPAGTHSRTFIPLQTRQLYKSNIACTHEVDTEGEIKAAVAVKLLGKGTAVFGHSGISNYRECKSTKKFAVKKAPAAKIWNYDSDAIKADDRQRLANFFNSAFWAITEKITSDRLQGLTLPKYYICIQNPNQPHKGLDDILLANGDRAAREFKTCQTSEYFIFAEIDPNNVHECLCKFFNYNDHKLKQYNNSIVLRDNYYSDKKNKVRTRVTDIFASNRQTPIFQFGCQLEVITGAGKTTNFIKAAALQKAVYFAPLTSIIEQVYSDAIKAGVNAIKYTGILSEREHLADLLNSKDMPCSLPQVIICTIASARSLAEMLKCYTKVYHIVIDEFHTFTSAANAKFMLRQLNELLDTAPLYRSVGTMTGTPLLNLHPATKDIPKIVIKLTGEPKAKAQYLSAADPLQATALQFKKAIAEGKKAYILFNNKTAGLDDLMIIFKKLGIINYSTFNADKKDSPEWLELLQTGLIPAGIDGFITTSVFEMGTNNNTETPAEVITLGEFHPVTIKQFKERQRLAECTLTIIQKHRNEPKRARYIGADEPDKMVKAAENVCTILNNDPAGLYLLGLRNNLQNMYVRHTASGYVPDYLAIQNFVFELQKIWFNSSPKWLLKELEKYSFNVYADDERKKLAIVKVQDERDADIKVLSQSSRDERKEASQRTFEAILQELTLQPFPQIAAAKKEKSKSSTKDEREYCQMFLDIRTEAKDDATALKLFGQSKGKNSKVKLIIQRLKVKKANFDHELGNAPAAILRTFAVGQRYSPELLKNTFIDCLRNDPTINLKPFERCGIVTMDESTGTEKLSRIDAILKKLRMFFDVMPADHKGMEYKITELPPEYS